MRLSRRPTPYIVPSYSLTGDLLSFLRCGLQYRYTGIGRLPATRPAQMWFGQFIHGVLEECYRRYLVSGFVPASEEIDESSDLVRRRLAVAGLRARNRDLEDVGAARAHAAVSILGPELFPIISQAEVRLTGTRPLDHGGSKQRARADWYEMAGIVDVITDVQLADPGLVKNSLVSAILAALPTELPERFEVIVDYKGMRRPATRTREDVVDYWQIYEWQLQTYALLRSVQPGALPVAGGVLIYLNELHPTWSDLRAQAQEARQGSTDVVPRPGTKDAAALDAVWRDRSKRGAGSVPNLSVAYRRARALRVVPISDTTEAAAARQFDRVVGEIESARAAEQSSMSVLSSWPQNADDAATCVACDYRTFCPEYDREMKPSPPRLT